MIKSNPIPINKNLKYGALSTKCDLVPDREIDVVYDPALTIPKIRTELDKKIARGNVGVIIVDYINQVKRSAMPSRGGQYDWTEQIEVSKTLKSLAQEYECAVVTPYQTDLTGEARFAKGILDAADAAYSLETWEPTDNCMTFNCTKMRNNEVKGFSSEVNWKSLKIGPASALTPSEKQKMKEDMGLGTDGEEAQDL